VPRYLPRVGLAPQWVAYARPLVLVLFGIDVIITLIFHADVDAQGGAYATGVLVLMTSAAIAAAISLGKEGKVIPSLYCWAVVVVFIYTTTSNIFQRPDGIIIATLFIIFILILSGISRAVRATELRVEGHRFCDDESKALWEKIRTAHVNLVPVSTPTSQARARAARKIATNYHVDGPLAFVHVKLLDNRSEFLSPIEISITEESGHYILTASQAVATANALAYLIELLHPSRVFLGLSRQNLMRQSFRYLLLGEGEVGLMVYTILQRYWEGLRAVEDRPRVFLMSD
jgi:hypothetical protein